MSSPVLKTTTPSNSLLAQLQQVGLRALPSQLDDFLARAAKARWSPHQILEQLAQAELAERSRRSLERRLRLSGIKSSSPWLTLNGTGPPKSNARSSNAR
jgi:DNA replication protein DnaC